MSWGFPKTLSLYYSLIYGICLGNVVMGMEKCGKMCENVEKCVKMCWRPVFYILLIGAVFGYILNADGKQNSFLSYEEKNLQPLIFQGKKLFHPTSRHQEK